MNMQKIKLSSDKGFALVDDEDFDYLSHWAWQLHSGGYAYRGVGNGKKSLSIYMHREVNKTPAGSVTDHINGDKLDNRRANLRSADKSLNAINTGIRNTNKSGYTGVAWSKLHSKWEAYIWKDNKKYHLGIFVNIAQAIRARRAGELKYYGR